MYVIAIHDIIDAEKSFPRGEKLQTGTDAPAGVNVLQFYPATDSSRVVCLWEGPSARVVQEYVDSVLGDSASTACFEVAAEPAFAERPLGLATKPLAVRSA